MLSFLKLFLAGIGILSSVGLMLLSCLFLPEPEYTWEGNLNPVELVNDWEKYYPVDQNYSKISKGEWRIILVGNPDEKAEIRRAILVFQAIELRDNYYRFSLQDYYFFKNNVLYKYARNDKIKKYRREEITQKEAKTCGRCHSFYL